MPASADDTSQPTKPSDTPQVQQAETGFPLVSSPALTTPAGTPYLRVPGVALLSKPDVNVANLADFLGGFSPDLHFLQYLDDPTPLSPAAQLCKTAGQLCYASFAPKRTLNADADRYFRNILDSGHGSVLEHANFSFVFYGISRSVTHELVRHRAGFGYCLAGDTLIYSDRFVNGVRTGVKKRRIDDLYQMSQTSYGRSRLKIMRLRCLDEQTNQFSRGHIRSVVCSGVKPVFKVELEDGKSITCSKDHRFLTACGWQPLECIVGSLTITAKGLVVYDNVDAQVMINGILAHRDYNWLQEQYLTNNLSMDEMSALAGTNRKTIGYWLRKHNIRRPDEARNRWTHGNAGKLYTQRDWLHEQYIVLKQNQETIAKSVGVSEHTIKSWIRKHNLQKPLGSWTCGTTPWNKGKTYKGGWTHTPEMRKQLGEKKRGENNPQWRGGITKQANQIRKGVSSLRQQILLRDEYRCRLCGQNSDKLTMHHILPVWARPDLVSEVHNIASVCRTCHYKLNGRELDYVEQFGKSLSEIPPNQRQRKGQGNLLLPHLCRIQSITFVGEQMTYDIEMEGDNHNFVANGIVTHNSQISQRYVSGRVLRFVERPEYQNDAILHEAFEKRIDGAAADYERIAERLLEQQKAGDELLSGEARTDLRKKVQQAARSALPNETEAPIVVTGNVRAWRHFLEMRANPHAETEIRALAFRTFLCLQAVEPLLFSDYHAVRLPDGTDAVETEFRKV